MSIKHEYENDLPIDDDIVVLDLLYNDRWEWKIDRRLYLPCRNSYRSEPYVRVFRSEFTIWDFRVAPGVGERLLARWLVEGKKHWGYTDDRDLSISDHGRTFMRETFEGLGIKYDDNFIRRPRADQWLRESVRVE
jgi:hypothetical protein